MPDNDKARVWAAAVISGCGLAAMTALLIARVQVVDIIAGFSALGTLLVTVMGLMLYGKMQKVETNTNGNIAAKDAQIAALQSRNDALVSHITNGAIPVPTVVESNSNA